MKKKKRLNKRNTADKGEVKLMLKDRPGTTRQRPRQQQIKAKEGYVKREYCHIVMSTSESLTSALTRRAGV